MLRHDSDHTIRLCQQMQADLFLFCHIRGESGLTNVKRYAMLLHRVSRACYEGAYHLRYGLFVIGSIFCVKESVYESFPYQKAGDL